MLILPALDLLGGEPVRLVQGRYDHVLSYPFSPLDLADRYRQEGAEWLHVVDLDGARDGAWRHLSLVRELVRASGLRVQVGGGARSFAAVAAMIDAGVQRVVVGTAALERPTWLEHLVTTFGEQVAVSLDSSGSRLLVRGWTEASGLSLLEGARQAIDAGVRRLIHTNVSRDGTLSGTRVGALSKLSQLGVPVIAAGGVGGLADLGALRAAGVEGVVIGRALLERRLSLGEAMKACR